MLSVEDVFKQNEEEYKTIKRQVKEKRKEKEKQLNLKEQQDDVIKKTKEKFDSFFRTNEIFAKEVQIMTRKSIRGDLFETIKLFMACVTTLSESIDAFEGQAGAGNQIISSLWVFVPKLIEYYQKYLEADANSMGGQRPLYVINFQKARYDLIHIFSVYYTQVMNFINKTLSGTIIYTRNVRDTGMLNRGYDPEIVDEIDSENEDDEDEEDENETEESEEE